MTPDALERSFLEIAAAPDETLDLARAAVLLARHDHPDLDPDRPIRQLDLLARNAPDGAGSDVEVLASYLYGEVGFRGNRIDYYDVRNSYLHLVLERKLGIPISLATVVLEVGRRLGHRLRGVGFPRHFLVEVEPGSLFLDPFDQGRLLDRSGCIEMFRKGSRGEARFEDRFLEPVDTRQILVRMLNNILSLSIRDGDPLRVRFCLDSIVQLLPTDPGAHLQRGRYLFQAGDATAAIPDFEAYLHLSPEGAARRAVEDALQEAVRRGATIH